MITSLNSVTRLTQYFGRSLGGDQEPSAAAARADTDIASSSTATPTVRTSLDTASARHDNAGTEPTESRSRPTLPDHIAPLGQLDEIHFEHNRSVSFRRIDNLAAILRQADPAMALRISHTASELKQRFDDGKHAATAAELLPALLPDHVLRFAADGFNEEGDHAALVAHIADATGRLWNPQDTTSNFEADLDKWVVRFQEDGFWRQWRFAQEDSRLNPNFVQQVIQRAESHSGHKMVFFDTADRGGDMMRGMSLPFGLHQRLVNDELVLPQGFAMRQPDRTHSAFGGTAAARSTQLDALEFSLPGLSRAA